MTGFFANEYIFRDPAVAKRVRCLRINPNFTQDFVQAWEKRNGENSWKTGLNVVMKHIREPPFTSKVSGAEAVPKYSSSQQTLIAAVVEAVSYLSNVVHCDVTWVDPATVQHLNPFIPVAWSTFGSNLRKLTLGGDLDGLRLLASSSTHFVSLQELELEFMHNVVRMHDTSDLACLVDVLAPFVNGLSPRLRHLSITSWASLELSSFFQKLTFFPILQQLTIRISFNKAFPHDHSGLTRLLHDQSHTLKCVTLRFNPSGWMSFSSTEDSLVRWMEEAASDTSVLTDLQTLHIYPTMMPAGFEAFLVYLKRSANTLTSLIVRERYLSYDEVDSVVTTFLHRPPESRLKYLRLNVRILSVRVMDLLAEKVPMLERLALIVGKGWTEERAGAALSTPVRPFIFEFLEIFMVLYTGQPSI